LVQDPFAERNILGMDPGARDCVLMRYLCLFVILNEVKNLIITT